MRVNISWFKAPHTASTCRQTCGAAPCQQIPNRGYIGLMWAICSPAHANVGREQRSLTVHISCVSSECRGHGRAKVRTATDIRTGSKQLGNSASGGGAAQIFAAAANFPQSLGGSRGGVFVHRGRIRAVTLSLTHPRYLTLSASCMNHLPHNLK